MKKKMVLLIAALFMISGLAAGEAKASLYDLTYLINGVQPEGSSWLTADFQTVATGTVTLTLSSNFSTNPADPTYPYYFQEVAFNVDPTIVPSSLSISRSASSGVIGTVTIANTTQDAQGMVGSGTLGGGFDVLLSFPTAGGQQDNGRFGLDNSITFTITGTGITAASFDFLNTANAAHVGAHLAGIPGGLSGAVGDVNLNPVPIPAAVWLLGSGLLGLVAIRRRFKK
ncbi:MAG: VPLPA-CTERM sorting domain-containing protein [Deltaproteobacteria bacterium]|nr:VPLPA-CTERM sorting domain-containing protein [Deltaproteobacteria bacterium]